jgi:hypothetical protein
MESGKITGALLVGGSVIALFYFVSQKKTLTGASAVAGAPPGVTGSLRALLPPGLGGPATVNAGGRTIAAAPPPGSSIGAIGAINAGSSGSFPNIVASAAALLGNFGRAITPGPSQAPAKPVATGAFFSIGQTQGLADLSALTARTQDELSTVSTYDALPNTLVDPGYGSQSPDLAGLVAGLDTASIPTFDFSSGADVFDSFDA